MATNERGIRLAPDWGAAVKAGLIAGLVFLVLEMLLVPIFLGGSPWGPPRMIAAIVMGRGVLPPPPTFDLGVFVVAMVLHFALSIGYTLVLAAIIAGMSRGTALTTGAVYGLVLYLVNFFGFAAAFPWFAMARNWVSVFSHIVFGLVAAGAYVALRSAVLTTAASRRAGAEIRAWAGPERRQAQPAPGLWNGPERRRAYS